MAEGDIQVILNELRHIRSDIRELKDAREDVESYKLKVALLEEKIKDYDSIREKINCINTEKSTLEKVLPYGLAFTAWLAGGGWKFFVG